MARESFQTELTRLRGLLAAFAGANPALAPLLHGPMADPDVERLLDAVAFQNDLLGQKLASDLPELIRTLVHLVLPHYLRPIPASTIIGFTPLPAMERSVTVPAGTLLASIPVEETCCRFRTTCDLEVHPLELTDASIVQTAERSAEIRLSFKLHRITLSQWRPRNIRLFLAGDRVTAAELYKLLRRRLRRIVVSAADAGAVQMPPGYLKPTGFDESEALVPYPPHAFPGYRLLQEYFNFAEKFLFFELCGWDRWLERGKGNRFTVSFQLDDLTSVIPKIGTSNFVLNAIPAVNLFCHYAIPISLDHRASRYLVRPCGINPSHQRIFSVDRVTGVTCRTGRERSYGAFELFGTDSPHEPVYHAGLERSQVRGSYDVYLAVAFPDGTAMPVGETLSIELTCTNGTLPGNLRIGDIRIPEAGIPETVTFSNITPVNPGVPPFLGPGLLWRLTTHLYLNHATLGSAEQLRTLLRLYLFADGSVNGSMTANQKRIAGVEEIVVMPEESMIEGVSVRGSHVRMKVSQDHFAGSGDLYLFGCVLDRFLAEYSSLNCFTRLTIDELLRGESYQWPMRQE